MRKLFLLLFSMIAIVNCFGQTNTNAKTYIKSLQSSNNPFYSGFQGDFSVTDNGAAVYDIPFPVTPGVGGMTPKISVSYNSNNSTSILGEGWALNGFSVISRSPNIFATDLKTQAILFNNEDKLNLDGSRLVLLDNNDTYGSGQTEYRTENNTFKRITIPEIDVAHGSVNGIKYFKVESKDGLEYYYGNFTDRLLGVCSGVVVTNTIDRSGIPYLWLLTVVKDKNGNWIKYDYKISNNFYRPKQISYGSKGNKNPIGKIEFSYIDEDKANNHWGWLNQKYIQGEKITVTHPLGAITSYYLDESNSPFVIRTYKFDYTYDPISNKLILKRVFQEVKQSARTKKIDDSQNAILFDWIKTDLSQKEFLDSLLTTTIEQVTLSEDFKIAIADFNGDGFPDKLMHKNFGNKIVFYLSINDTKGKFTHTNHIDTINTSINAKAKVSTGDFNADGRNDIIYLSNDNNKLSLFYYTPELTTNGEFNEFKETVKKDVISLPSIDDKKINYGFGDFNSDGYSDILIYYFEGDKLKYQPLTFGRDTVFINSQKESTKGNIPEDNYLSQLTDINGDGITDLFFTWTNKDGWFTKSYIFNNSVQLGLSTDLNVVRLRDGINYDIEGYSIDTTQANSNSQVIPISTTIKTGDYSKLGNIMLADLNKDGNIDIVISNTGKDGWEYYTAIGKGNGQFEFNDKRTIGSEKFSVNHKSNFGDFNGDGLMDLIIQRTDANGWHKLIAYGNGKGEFNLKSANEKFQPFLHKDFTYSQQYLTNNVLPYLYKSQYSLLFNDKLTLIDCSDKNNYECVMSSIRKIFPVETGFYPDKVNRTYANPIAKPLEDFIKTNLNFENNVKRIVGASFTGDSIVSSMFGTYYYYSKITYGDYWQPYVVDLNGDGISDLLLTYPIQVPSDAELGLPKNSLEDSLYTFTIINQSEKPGFITEITHSNKSKTKIKYASVLQNHETDLPKSELNYPFIPFNGSIYTVSEVGVSNGITVDSIQRTKYIYQNGITALNGRGFLGFEGHKIINLSNSNYSTKSFWTDASFLQKGLMPVRNMQTFISGFKHNVSDENYEYVINQSENKSFNIYCSRQTSNTHELNNVPTSRSETEYTYDNYGNLVYSKNKTGELGQNEIIKEVNNTYYESSDSYWEQNWLLGRLQYSTVKTSRNGVSLSRTSFFEYDSLNGQLIKEISDTGNTKFSLTKEYRLNQYGNIDTSIVYPTNNKLDSEIRTTITIYSKDKRFVEKTIDAGRYVTTKNIEPVQGLLTSTTFAEAGNKTMVSADEIGRFQTTTSPDGTISKTERRIYNDGEFKNIATYFLLETNNISDLPTVTFYNSAGRVVRKVNFDFKDREIITVYIYDNNGNLISESLPYFKGNIVNYTTYQYDEFNRRILTTLPDNSTVAVKYFGLNDTTINAKGQKTISQKNILGELETSIDDNGFSISYTYDLFGRITQIKDANNNTYTMKYDINGNRIEYKNPNFKNLEKADYNAFNQKISSIDPNGYPKYYQYDKLDRLKVLKAERAGIPKERIEYGYIEQADALSGKGKIKSIKSYSDDHPIDEEFTYYENGQLKSHTYKYFSLNQRTGGGNVFTYSGSPTKDNLQYTYTYDKSQVKTITYPFTGQTVDKKLTVQYSYANGTLVNTTGVLNGKSIKFWELINSNSLGLTTSYKLGDNIITNQVFDNTVFNLERIEYATNERVLTGMNYSYDELGNLIFRKDINNSTNYDSIFYDNLNRVIEVKTNSYSTKVNYFTNGDIKQKIYGGDYQFDFAYQQGTNKFKTIKFTDVKHSQNNRTETFNNSNYDNYGNETSTFSFLVNHSNTPISYNQYNLPFQIGALRFYYAFDGSKDAIYDYNLHTGIAYLGNLSEFNYQFNNSDGNGFLKYQKMNILVNGKIIANVYSNTSKVEFLLKDVLNTVIGIANDKGKLIDSLAYDIWGLKRNAKDWKYDWKQLAKEVSNPKDKGFLNSTSFEGYGLVDFSARLYNPITGRFISVDPITDNRYSNTQFANPYLYGYNNPTVFVDANGKFGFIVAIVVAAYIGGSAAGGSLLPWQWNDNWWKGALVGVATVAGGYAIAGPAMFTGGMSAGTAILSGAAAGFAGGFTATLVNGGNFAQALENGFKGGVIGGVTAGVTFGIGQTFGNPETFSGGYFAKASLHGLNQGITSEAMGGSFEHGFLAGSFVSAMQPMTKLIGNTPEERIVISSMIGGTASSLGGGKFANGAISGALIQIYNENCHPDRNINDHFGRNKNNVQPKSLSMKVPYNSNIRFDEQGRMWENNRTWDKYDLTNWHGGDKWLSYDNCGGSYEAIFDANNNLINSGSHQGTYNYFDPRQDFIKHIRYDFLPSMRPGGSNYIDYNNR